MGTLEEAIGREVMAVVGAPEVAGLILLALFVGVALMQNSKLDGKLVIIVPAAFLAMALFPWWNVAFVIVAGFFIGKVIQRLLGG